MVEVESVIAAAVSAPFTERTLLVLIQNHFAAVHDRRLRTVTRDHTAALESHHRGKGRQAPAIAPSTGPTTGIPLMAWIRFRGASFAAAQLLFHHRGLSPSRTFSRRRGLRAFLRVADCHHHEFLFDEFLADFHNVFDSGGCESGPDLLCSTPEGFLPGHHRNHVLVDGRVDLFERALVHRHFFVEFLFRVVQLFVVEFDGSAQLLFLVALDLFVELLFLLIDVFIEFRGCFGFFRGNRYFFL